MCFTFFFDPYGNSSCFFWSNVYILTPACSTVTLFFVAWRVVSMKNHTCKMNCWTHRCWSITRHKSNLYVYTHLQRYIASCRYAKNWIRRISARKLNSRVDTIISLRNYWTTKTDITVCKQWAINNQYHQTRIMKGYNTRKPTSIMTVKMLLITGGEGYISITLLLDLVAQRY